MENRQSRPWIVSDELWSLVEPALPKPVRRKNQLDWERGGDRLLARAGRPTGPKSGPSPVDRARPGTKHHLIVDGQGTPLAGQQLALVKDCGQRSGQARADQCGRLGARNGDGLLVQGGYELVVPRGHGPVSLEALNAALDHVPRLVVLRVGPRRPATVRTVFRLPAWSALSGMVQRIPRRRR
jgi:hypothetical protein